MTRHRVRSIAAADNRAGYFFIGPWILGFLVFTAGPMLASVVLSFTRYDFLSRPRPVGLANYVKMFTGDYHFWDSMKVTLKWVLIREPLFLSLALAAALLLNRIERLRGFYRTLFYVPSIVSGTVSTAVMWKMLLSHDGQVNQFLLSFGVPAVSWFASPGRVFPALVATSLFGFGGAMVVFLAGLKNIPATYYEAATMDGAGGLRRFTGITLPMLSPVILYMVVMGCIWAFQAFTFAFIVSEGTGGPLNKTLFYMINLYRNAFVYFNGGYASALAWFMFLMTLVFTLLVLKSSQIWVFYESEVLQKRRVKAGR